jgi:hypothetical protein
VVEFRQLFLPVTAKNAAASRSTFLVPQCGQEIRSLSCSARVRTVSKDFLQSLQTQSYTGMGARLHLVLLTEPESKMVP